MTRAVVDRVFWRAGFGATEAERATWIGRGRTELVDYLVSTPQSYATTSTPALNQSNEPVDPRRSTTELVLEWLDAMMRARNPLAERLALFWHDHWAVARGQGIATAWMLAYRERLRRFGDFGTNPDASFRDMALEMSTRDGALLYFLNGHQNTKEAPNENYGREFVELFTLGVRDAAGDETYTQADIVALSRAFTGWDVDERPEASTFGKTSFHPAHFDDGPKTLFGETRNWGADPASGSGSASLIDKVLAHPAHAPFLVTKLWDEFIAVPIAAARRAELAAAYVASGYKLKPLIRSILLDPLLLDSLDAPNMIKPPVVFVVGAQRALGAPLKAWYQPESLVVMQQELYEPPNVSGWEGGAAWINTTTVQARFDVVQRMLTLKHDPSDYPGAQPLPDYPNGTAQDAVARARAATNDPWLAPQSLEIIESFAAGYPSDTADRRLQRDYALRRLLLGGPDFQVM